MDETVWKHIKAQINTAKIYDLAELKETVKASILNYNENTIATKEIIMSALTEIKKPWYAKLYAKTHISIDPTYVAYGLGIVVAGVQ